jgi:hypothetical protein
MPFDLASAKPASGGFDLASAKPVNAPTAAAPAPTDTESPTSFKNLAGAVVELMLSMATGAASAVPAGLAGIGTAIGKATGLTDKEPGDVVRSVQSGMTYEPRTTGGRNAMSVIGAPFQAMSEGAETAGRKVQDWTGSPGLAAQAETALKFVPQMMMGAKAGDMAGPGKPSSVRPEVGMLADKGVTMTPGQILGGGWDKAEQALSKWPLIGGSIKAARGRAVEDFNNAAINDTLSPIGAKLPDGMKGQAAVAHAYDKLGERYDDLLVNMRGSLDSTQPAGGQIGPGPMGPPAPSLRNELDTLKSMTAQSKMPRKYQQELGRIFDEDIIGRFEKSGLASGQTLKDVQSQLTTLAKKKAQSDDRDVNKQGLAIAQAKQAVDRMIERENPQYADELKAVNDGYAKFKIVQRAAASTGAKEGIFTPAQFQAAVRAKDATKDKRAFSEGEARQQPLAQAGKSVLGDTMPDSGSPYQLAIYDLLLGGGGHALLGPQGIAAGLAIPVMYSQAGTSAMQSMLMNPPNIGRGAAMAGPLGASQPPQQ